MAAMNVMMSMNPSPFPLKIMLAGALGLYATLAPLRPQDVVFKSSASTASLVELYSSEGCSSCPPAEEWINNFKSDPGLWKNVFPLVFHVNYWDNLGWPDRFARPEYTQRQDDYAARLGQDSVYTPEFIVNGLEWRRGIFGGQGVSSPKAAKTGELSLTVHGGEGKFSALYLPGSSGPKQPLSINVARLGLGLFTDVLRGENAGTKLEHDFVVLGYNSAPLHPAPDKGLRAEASLPKPSTSDVPAAVVAWVSAADGSILQVTGGPLPAAK
jgi:hypothetical protein